MARNPRPIDGGLAIMVAAAAPMGAIVSLALGCYIGLSAPEVLAVAFLFTALLTIYAHHLRRDGSRPLLGIPQERPR